jgi:hypothetical protein
MKRAIAFLVLSTCFIFSCSKNNENDDESGTAAFTLVERIPGTPRLYERADLVMHNNEPFVCATSSEFGNFNSVFLFPLKDGWRAYEQPNQEFLLLTNFNKTIYGIMEFREPFQNGQVAGYRYSYFLYKWINEAFENIAQLNFTDHNNQKNTALQSLRWWINEGKLHLMAQQSNGTSFLWNLTNDRFEHKIEIGNTGLSAIVLSSASLINFTNYRQLNGSFDRTDKVTGFYFDGQSLQTGKEHVFQETLDGSFNSTYSFYAAIGKNLFGIRGGELRNLDTDKTIVELDEGLQFQVSGIRAVNGKLYMLLGKGDSDCSALGVFDGITFKQYSYMLPAVLDPCSRLLDVEELNGKLYCLVLSNRQLAVVQRWL